MNQAGHVTFPQNPSPYVCTKFAKILGQWYLLGNDATYANDDFSRMIGHGMCNANLFTGAENYDESYFDPESNWANEDFFRLLELGSPNAYSAVDCDNVKLTGIK